MEIQILTKFGSPKPWSRPPCRCSKSQNHHRDIQKENQIVKIETESKANHDRDIEDLKEALNERDRLLRGVKLALSFEDAEPWSQQINTQQDDQKSLNDRDRRRQYLIERISVCLNSNQK